MRSGAAAEGVEGFDEIDERRGEEEEEEDEMAPRREPAS